MTQLQPDLPKWVQVIISPVFEITSVPAGYDLDDFAGVIFTSAQGVIHAQESGGVQAYCVGVETTRLAQAHGWAAQCVGETANELVAALTALRPPSPLLHIGGRYRRGGIARRLTEAGLRTDEATVYEQVPQPLSKDALAAISGPVPSIVPLFSPRSAKLFADAVQSAQSLHIIGMSQSVLDETTGLDAKKRWCAERPDAGSMRDRVLEALSRVEAGGAPL